MTIYMNRLFRKSNSSFLLSSGKALNAEVSRIKEDMFLVDSGLGSPRLTMRDELRGVPVNRTAARFENKVGFMDPVARETMVKTQLLERFFMDLVAGDSAMKERAAAKFTDMVGSTDAVAGEPHILLPRRFTQNQVWMELNKIWRSNRKVKGFIIEKVRGGYSVALAGFIAFLPYSIFRPNLSRRKLSIDRFTIESINPKTKKIVVF